MLKKIVFLVVMGACLGIPNDSYGSYFVPAGGNNPESVEFDRVGRAFVAAFDRGDVAALNHLRNNMHHPNAWRDLGGTFNVFQDWGALIAEARMNRRIGQ